jgi:nucleotide-binding universal stress UspA family protein
MQKILVPTDFSPVADNALNHAIDLAALFQAEILLYHVYNFQRSVHYNSNYPEHEQPFVKDIEKAMETTKQKFSAQVRDKGVSLTTQIKEDSVFALFGKEADEHHIDFIVMGSKGATGVSKVIFGSFAATAMDIAEVPVLVVPPACLSSPIKKIVLASDQEEVSETTLLPLQKLALKTKASVTVLNVKTGTAKNDPAQHLKLVGVETTHQEIPASGSVNETINNYVEEHNFDLIAMIRRDRGFFEGLFKRSITKDQVYNSSIPILILPE